MTGRPGDRDADHARLAAGARDLVSFFQPACRDPAGGFLRLDLAGRPVATPVRDLVSQARLTYSFALAHLMGCPGARALAEHGVAWLLERHRDPYHGGYYWEIALDGTATNAAKQSYGHAFVLLAGAAGRIAGIDRASELFDDAELVIEERFWVEDQGRYQEELAEDWRPVSGYRGQNSNMHMTEALLTAFDASGNDLLLQRAVSVAEHLVRREAARHRWRVQEHHDAAWRPRPGYHRDRPRDMYRPYGTIPGHSWEWARLLIQLQHATSGTANWFAHTAEELYSQAFADAWDQRKHPVYTIDEGGAPVIADVVWWPIAEAIGAAAVLLHATRERRYEEDYVRLWEYADRHVIDHRHGVWPPVLTAGGRVKQDQWLGPPDLYHALQACLIPLCPSAVSVAGGLRDRVGPSLQDRTP